MTSYLAQSTIYILVGVGDNGKRVGLSIIDKPTLFIDSWLIRL
jgi:hypothetical protein